jgi:hypothetical protein
MLVKAIHNKILEIQIIQVNLEVDYHTTQLETNPPRSRREAPRWFITCHSLAQAQLRAKEPTRTSHLLFSRQDRARIQVLLV